MAVDRRFSWEELAAVVARNELDRLGRLPDDMVLYDKLNDALRAEFEEIDDHILHRVFGFPCIIDVVTGKKKIERSKIATIKRHSFVENHFPYAMEEGIQHHLIWSTYILEPKEIARIIKIGEQEVLRMSLFCE